MISYAAGWGEMIASSKIVVLAADFAQSVRAGLLFTITTDYRCC